MNPSSDFFNLVCIFSSKISSWFFTIFSLCWYSHFLHASFSRTHWASSWQLFLNYLSGASISLGLVAGDLFCPFDFSCFFLYLVKFMMGSTHLKKQTSLLVFMDVLCVRRDLHQSAQLESLGSSQTFLWMYLLWTCVCKFSIIGICLQALIVFCSLWCLFTVLHVL